MIAWVVDSLSHRADTWVREWHKTNEHIKRQRYPAIERMMLSAAELPAKACALPFLIAASLSFICWLLPLYYPEFSVTAKWVDNDYANFLTYFGTLWTVQATVVALVYPIVISFVSVLIQRRATSKLSLELYLLSTAAIPAGLSALGLVIWMGIEYLAIPYAKNEWVIAAMAGNTLWFTLNSLTTARFLYKTVKYLNDGERLEIYTRFAVQQAFPREAHEHLLGLLFSNAQANKLLPGASYGSMDGDGVEVMLYPIDTGTACVSTTLKSDCYVKDVRLRLLRWGISRWLTKVSNISLAPTFSGLKRQHPLLVIPVRPGAWLSGKVVLCRVENAPAPDWLASFLIKHSFVFKKSPAKNAAFSAIDILEEVAIEALSLAEQKRYEAAREKVIELCDIHVALLKAAEFVNDEGLTDTAAMLPDPYGFGSTLIHETWLEVYRPLAEFAVQNFTTDTTMFGRHCYLASRITGALKAQPLSVLTGLMHISTHLMYQLGLWWAARVEERGLEPHDANHKAALQMPLAGAYEHALRSFVGGWERVELRESEDDDGTPTTAAAAWAKHSRKASFAASKAEQTVRMILRAVSGGDSAGAFWLADSFMDTWRKEQRRSNHYGYFRGGPPLITITDLEAAWPDIRKQLEDIPEGEREIAFAGEIAALVLHRYMSDLTLVLVLILLDWTSAEAPPGSLAMELAVGLMRGQPLKESTPVDIDEFTGTSQVLSSLFRIQLAPQYCERLDKIVDFYRDLCRPSQVSGRIYSRYGADDIESLSLEQTQLLVAITSAPSDTPPEISDQLEKRAFDIQHLQDMKSVAQRLINCLDSTDFVSAMPVAEAIHNAIGTVAPLADSRSWVRGALVSIVDAASKTYDNTLETAQLSQARLDEFGAAVSLQILGTDIDIFPFTLNPEFEAVQEEKRLYAFNFEGASKMPFTEPPLEALIAAESERYAERIAQGIAANLVLSYIRQNGIIPLDGTSEDSFFKTLALQASSLREKGLTPLLVVSGHQAPKWVYPWHHQHKENMQADRPSVKEPKQNAPASVIAHIDNIVAHGAPIGGRACYVLPEEHFKKLRYVTQDGKNCLVVTATEQENHKLTIRFQTAFELVPPSAGSPNA